MASTLNITNLTLSIDSDGQPSFSNGKYNYIINMAGNYVSLKAGRLKIYMYDHENGNQIFELFSEDNVKVSNTGTTIDVKNLTKESTLQSIGQFILKAEFTPTGASQPNSAWSHVMTLSTGLTGKTNEAIPGTSVDE